MKKSQNSWGNRFLQKQKRILEVKLNEYLEQQIQARKGAGAVERDELTDTLDLANALMYQMESMNLVNDCTEQIFRVKRAILDIKEGNYGLCDNCNKKITVQRLRAIPWATKCVDCQQAEELHEKHGK